MSDEARGGRCDWPEICRRHANEWVVLVDTVRTNMVTTSGVIHGHSPRRDEAGALARGLRECAIFWTGEVHFRRAEAGR